jgi:glycine/sarcosine N-methyltransferase
MNYDSFSNHYDRFVNWPSRLAYEMPLVRELLHAAAVEPPARILDTACGTGMHAFALARQGYTAAGADISEGMIARAEATASMEDLQVPFVPVGFGNLRRAFEEMGSIPFDALLCLGNSLPHAHIPGHAVIALEDFAACLRPGGLLLIQNRNFDAVMVKKERWMEPQYHKDDHGDWVFLRFYDFLPDGNIDFNILTLQRSEGNQWKQQVTTTRLRPLLQDDLVKMVKEAGFDEVVSYGDMSGTLFDPHKSGNLILAARKSFAD